jgi:hypothetical protein
MAAWTQTHESVLNSLDPDVGRGVNRHSRLGFPVNIPEQAILKAGLAAGKDLFHRRWIAVRPGDAVFRLSARLDKREHDHPGQKGDGRVRQKHLNDERGFAAGLSGLSLRRQSRRRIGVLALDWVSALRARKGLVGVVV